MPNLMSLPVKRVLLAVYGGYKFKESNFILFAHHVRITVKVGLAQPHSGPPWGGQKSVPRREMHTFAWNFAQIFFDDTHLTLRATLQLRMWWPWEGPFSKMWSVRGVLEESGARAEQSGAGARASGVCEDQEENGVQISRPYIFICVGAREDTKSFALIGWFRWRHNS